MPNGRKRISRRYGRRRLPGEQSPGGHVSAFAHDNPGEHGSPEVEPTLEMTQENESRAVENDLSADNQTTQDKTSASQPDTIAATTTVSADPLPGNAAGSAIEFSNKNGPDYDDPGYTNPDAADSVTIDALNIEPDRMPATSDGIIPDLRAHTMNAPDPALDTNEETAVADLDLFGDGVLSGAWREVGDAPVPDNPLWEEGPGAPTDQTADTPGADNLFVASDATTLAAESPRAARSRGALVDSARIAGPPESPPATFGFQFRVKSSEAPTPDEAMAQADWLTLVAPTARPARRPESARSGAQRRSGRLDKSGNGPDEGLVVDSELVSGEIEVGPRSEAEETSNDIEIADSSPEPGTAEEAEGREERPGRSRRRKERGKGRRRDRNGSAESVAADTGVEEIPAAAVAAEDTSRLTVDVAGEALVPPEIAPHVYTPPALQDEELIAEADALGRISMDQRLGKEIFVNTGVRETRIAYVVSGMLTELHIEREERLVGAICKGRVERVLPGLDAAFVDVAAERNAFLMAGDVVPEEDEDEPSAGRRPHRHLSISDLVKPRQEIMVQITKAPGSTKGARVSTRVSLPGRYLVLMPESETTGVSRKIDDDHERDRLKKIARAIRPQGFGVIVRTEAENKTEEELRSDVEFLQRLWGQIQQKYRAARAPSIVHRDLSLTFKVIRDLFGSDVNRFVIDSREEYEKVIELVDFISPKLRSRVILYEDPIPLFERLGIEGEIERLFRHKVWLKSGGWLAIDETEALTAIDVNSGKYVGASNPAQTHFRINAEAVVEIWRQLRLRDIGGMIILDFIDMSNAKDRQAIMKSLDACLKRDRSRTKIAHLSPLGLVEMTRKRSGETFSQVTTEQCSYCGGRGRTLNPDTVSILVEREIRKQSLELDDEAFLVMVNPAVAPYLVGTDGTNVDRLERELRRAVYVQANDSLHIESYEVIPADMQEIERQLLPFREGQVLDMVVEQNAGNTLPPHALARIDGYFVDLTNGGQYLGRRVRVRLTRIGRSLAAGEVIGAGRVVDKLGGS